MSKHSKRRVFGRVTAGVVAAATIAATIAGVSLTSSGASADTATTYPVPDQDPFYKAPANIASIPNGQIIATRTSPAQIKDVGGTVQPLTGGWQISFRSNDVHNQPILAVTTVLVPKQAYTGTSKSRPMVTYAAAEDSTGTQCAPSYTLATGSNILTGQEQALMAEVLQKGFILNIPDHEGPNSAEMVGSQAGRIILDSIRAALAFSAAGTSSSTPVGIWGYSAAGASVGWAGELERSYAPDLAGNIKGVAFGGAPAKVSNSLNQLNGGPFVGFAIAAALGFAHAYPELDLPGDLNAKGRSVYAAADQKCIADFATNLAFTNINSMSDIPNYLATPKIQNLINSQNLGQAKPMAPVYYYYSITDEAIPTADSEWLWKTYCSMGVPTFPQRVLLGEHITTGIIMGLPTLAWLSDRFNNKAIMPWDTCHA